MTGQSVTRSQRGGAPRHTISEARNFFGAHMKRNDPASRRFIQYMAMQTTKVVVLARDGRNGQIILKPPSEQNWLVRSSSETVRVLIHNYEISKHVGEALFEEVDKTRKWSLNFRDYYDIYIWDVQPGRSFENIHKVTIDVSNPSNLFPNRSRCPKDAFQSPSHSEATRCIFHHAPCTRNHHAG